MPHGPKPPEQAYPAHAAIKIRAAKVRQGPTPFASEQRSFVASDEFCAEREAQRAAERNTTKPGS